jgi:hypothetical protein
LSAPGRTVTGSVCSVPELSRDIIDTRLSDALPARVRTIQQAGWAQASFEPANPEATARLTAAQLTHMIERCDSAGLRVLADILEMARIEAEKAVGGCSP